jgi:2-polyprenyl-3-methyl-5-hydroxy-6-metoxy-1,4-benzoquinol methylase
METTKHFEFGQNWQKFLTNLTESKIQQADHDLTDWLGELSGRTFLDIGSGSGLHSLSARRQGAIVFSFDYDPVSVSCTSDLKERYYPNDQSWTVMQGSALDEPFLRSLGQFDIVYSWGVLHHTGNLWKALDLASIPIKPGGSLMLALYNDEGWRSNAWKLIKRIYNLGFIGKIFILGLFLPPLYLRKTIKAILRGKSPASEFKEYEQYRGMSYFHDWVDWLGGYPFEVSRPVDVIDFYSQRGFKLVRLVETPTHGNNLFLFSK